jgi:hypothetical protein
MQPDFTAYIQRHPRYGHLELVLDAHTGPGSDFLDGAARQISGDVADTLADVVRAGLTVSFPRQGGPAPVGR